MWAGAPTLTTQYPNDAKRAPQSTEPRGTAREVFGAFLRLGLTSFGGPVAHMGYFRRELVERRRWVDDRHFAQLMAICQLLPGPASSQLGFALGWTRAGWRGALAAFLAFTAPSALLMFAFATAIPHLSGPLFDSTVQGLKLVALVVVAQAVLGMLHQLCADTARRVIAAAAMVTILVSGHGWMQIAVVLSGALAGLWFCRDEPVGKTLGLVPGYGTAAGTVLLVIFALLLLAAIMVGSHPGPVAQVLGAFYQAGALVFGGGHVVLPLLQSSVVEPGWVSSDRFLAGYGAAQVLPGPMFSLSAYLGAQVPGIEGPVGALLALVAIFLPGFLLLAAALPWWFALASNMQAVRAIGGINAAVVGLLGAALYDPVWTSAIRGPFDLAIGLVGFTMIGVCRWPVLAVVAWCVLASMALS